MLVDDEAFLARLKPLYAAEALDGIGKMLEVIRGREADESGGTVGAEEAVGDDDVFAMENPALTTEEAIERFKRPYLDRLYDLSAFVGEIKQRFSQWYNLRSKRNGPLW